MFAVEDLYGLEIGEIDGEVCLRLGKSCGTSYLNLFDLLCAWQHEAEMFRKGEITKEEYDAWRYTYPSIRGGEYSEH